MIVRLKWDALLANRSVMLESDMRQEPFSPVSNSLNPEEFDRFNRVGELWWDTKGVMRLLHATNPLRVDYIFRHVSFFFDRVDVKPADRTGRPLEGLDVADIGCGGGILSESLAQLGAKVIAIDPTPTSIEIARRHAARSNLEIDYRTITAEDLVSSGQQFDAVMAIELIDHVDHQQAFVDTLGKLVRPGGLLIFSTINRNFKSYVLAILIAEYVLGWVQRGMHTYSKFVKPDELSRWIREAGMHEIDRAGMTFRPLSGKWRESRDTSVAYVMVAKKS
jgi:2-polyprenyl-6-hydroxyphenyl methylase/3-demethylubiquinone-9 3-methyltransferase